MLDQIVTILLFGGMAVLVAGAWSAMSSMLLEEYVSDSRRDQLDKAGVIGITAGFAGVSLSLLLFAVYKIVQVLL